MFDDIAGKIKALAKVTCGLGIAVSLMGAFALWAQSSPYNSTTLAGILVLVLGSLASWIGSFFTYGFGELIENTNTIHLDNLKIQELLKKTKEENASSTTVTHPTRMSQSNDEWECAFCGMRNSKSTNSCVNCGCRRISP